MPKIKCIICKKKLNLIRQTIFCKCSKEHYCEVHINDHSCNYDHRKDYEKLEKLEISKVIKI
jgi:hypothetical protein